MFRKRWRGCAAVVSVLLVCADPAAAQDKGRTGLIMGYPAAIGVEVRLSGHVALRPEVTFTTHAVEYPDATYTHWDAGVGLSVPLYLHETGPVVAYIAPRFSYNRAVDTGSGSDVPPGHTTADSYQVAGSFGARCALSRRFGVYGDLGVAYTSLRSSRHADYGLVTRTGTWEPRVAVGAILHF